jgi:cobalt-zinc-cadmium efflux system outer membrane protein
MGLTDAYRRLAASTGNAAADFFESVATPSRATPALPAAAQLLAWVEQTTELRLAELQILQSEASIGVKKPSAFPTSPCPRQPVQTPACASG